MLQVKEPNFVTIDGRKMAYDEVSPPNPQGTVLLLTGLAGKRLGWMYQLDEFGKTFRTIAIDHRDTGDSDYVDQPYQIRDQAEDAYKVLQALGISKTHVVGISMGGFISLNLALHHPEVVDKLVLVSTSAGGPNHVPAREDIAAALVARTAESDPGVLARQSYSNIMSPGFVAAHPETLDMIADIARYKPQRVDGYFRQLQACLAHDVSGRLGEINIPTLVVHGTFDPLVPYPNGVNLAEKIPGAKFNTYQDTGHIPIMEEADRFNNDVITFLKG